MASIPLLYKIVKTCGSCRARNFFASAYYGSVQFNSALNPLIFFYPSDSSIDRQAHVFKHAQTMRLHTWSPSVSHGIQSMMGRHNLQMSDTSDKFHKFITRRQLFIQTQSTPNPSSLMFLPGREVMKEGGSADFSSARAAMASPLAKVLFRIDGVVSVFFGSDFVTVTKSEGTEWGTLKPDIFAAIMDFFASDQPLLLDPKAASTADTIIHEDDGEVIAMIKELLDTRIRPAVQDDGGDIEYQHFNEDTGILTLKMQGACKGCPSSAVTLKSGIQNMLMHYVPEVKGVEEYVEIEDDDLTDKEFDSGEISSNFGRV